MKTEEMKTAVKSLSELNRNYAEVILALKETSAQTQGTKRLWRTGNNPKMIKVGLALIALPEPITSVVGAFLVTAGSVQQGIRRRTLYVEDMYKAFQDTLKAVARIKENV